MRYALFLLLLVTALSVPTAQAATPTGFVPVGSGDVYLALGDSLATGTEEAGNNDNQAGYPPRLLPMLQALRPTLSLQNLARDGETSTTMISGGQLAAAEQLIASERAQGRRIGLVTVTIGGNDLLQVLPAPAGSSANPATVLAAYRTNLATILDRLITALTVNGVRQGDLVLIDVYNPYPGLEIPFQGALADIWQPQLNAVLKELAAARGLPVAEVAAAFVGREAELIYVQRPYAALNPLDPALATKFDYHPRPAGHQVIANEVIRSLGYRFLWLPLAQRS